MSPDSSKSLHPARLSKLPRLRPLPTRGGIHPSMPAAELFARMATPRLPLEALVDVEVRPEPGAVHGVVVDVRERLERRARARGEAIEAAQDPEHPEAAEDAEAPEAEGDGQDRVLRLFARREPPRG